MHRITEDISVSIGYEESKSLTRELVEYISEKMQKLHLYKPYYINLENARLSYRCSKI